MTRVIDMLTLDQIVRDEFGEDHVNFKNLLKQMLKIDPRERLNASTCLQHSFFLPSQATAMPAKDQH